MNEPAAYLLTWTCYGTWLHGDHRGSVDFRHNEYGAPYVAQHAYRELVATARLKHSPVLLDRKARMVTRGALVGLCRDRGWTLFALNVRTNHVHMVACCGGTAPDRAIGQCKARATRDLRNAACFSGEHRIWTERGSGRYLWKPADVDSAVAYVMDHQGRDLD